MKIIVLVFLINFFNVHASLLPCNCNFDKSLLNTNSQVAKINSIPWMASIATIKEEHFCNAAIVNEKFLLIADHCFKRRYSQIHRVHVGLNDRTKMNQEKTFSLKKVIRSTTEFGPLLGDFALIEIKTPITFIPGQIEPACLNFEDKVFKDNLLVAGWGFEEKIKIDYDFDYPKYNSSLLNYYLGTENSCEKDNICVTPKSKDKSICNSDRSSILMETKDNKVSIIGVGSSSKIQTSQENHCVGQTSFSRLSLQKNFIQKHAKEFCSFA